MKKIIYLTDFSNIAYEAIHSMCGYNGKNLKADRVGKFLEEKSEREDFLANVDDRYKSSIPKLKGSLTTFCIFDCLKGKSFRHTIYPEYKGNRDKNKMAFSQKHFKECLIEYKAHLESIGIQTFERDELEADDIITLVANELFNKGYSVVIMSRDKDLTQLLKNGKGNGIFYLNPTTKAFNTAKGFESPKFEGDFEFGGMFEEEITETDPIFDRRIEVNPRHVLLTKIIAGDSSDNINACIDYVKGVSTMKVSEARIDKILNDGLEVPEDISWDFVRGTLLASLNQEIGTKKEPNIIKLSESHMTRFHLNKDLIELSERVIPFFDSEKIKLELDEKLISEDFKMFEKLSIPMFEKTSREWSEMKEY